MQGTEKKITLTINLILILMITFLIYWSLLCYFDQAGAQIIFTK